MRAYLTPPPLSSACARRNGFSRCSHAQARAFGLRDAIRNVTPKGIVKSLPKGAWSGRGFWRGAATSLGHLVLVFAVLTGIRQSGARYFYCEAFGLMASDPCVQAVQAPRSDDQAVDEPLDDCCEVVTLPSLPEGARAERPTVAPPARIAVIPPEWQVGAWSTNKLPSANLRLQRWRPPRLDPREARARLMVFLT